jgi:hypothetical protein
MATKLVWLFALVAVSLVTADDIKGVLPNTGGWIDKPFKAIDPPMRVIDPMPKDSKILDMTVLKKVEPISDESRSNEFEPMLKPIGPIMPKFLQPSALFSHLEDLRKGLVMNSQAFEQQNELMNGDKPHKGIMTIILVKSKPHHDNMIENTKQDMNNFDTDMIESAQKNFHSLTNLIMNDLFGKHMNQGDQKMIEDRHPHLFGGDTDPDHRRQNGFIRYVTGDEMPMISDDIGIHDRHHKKCNFIKFLKMKAHIHYRTLIHLIFLSGVIMIMLMMLSLAIKVHKRRNALRRFYAQQNIDVSSISDSHLAKQKEAEGSPVRMGSFKSTYEQKMAPSALFTAPPAYDQINDTDRVEGTKTRSSLIKSLASAYKSRYQRTSSGQQTNEDDRLSISSLPEYQDKPENPKE